MRQNLFHIDLKCLILVSVFYSVLCAETIEADVQKNSKKSSENSLVKLELAKLSPKRGTYKWPFYWEKILLGIKPKESLVCFWFSSAYHFCPNSRFTQVHFFLKRTVGNLSPADLERLNSWALGLRVLSLLPLPQQQKCSALHEHPRLILEVLLMMKQLQSASLVTYSLVVFLLYIFTSFPLLEFLFYVLLKASFRP
jgi:hypothetical protein